MSSEQNFHFTTGTAKDIIIRQGKAEEIKEPKILNIVGVLDTPLRWLEKKKDDICFSQIDSHIIVDREKLFIKLVINETDYYSNSITGKLELHPDFKKFRINTGEQFTNFELADLIKMNRSVFENPTVAMKLVSDLKNFKAKIDKEIEKANNDRGNVKLLVSQFVESNLPERFWIEIPMFKGTPKSRIEVEIYIDASSLTCSMVSPHANDLVAEIRDYSIDEVLNQIKDLTPDIAILEV